MRARLASLGGPGSLELRTEDGLAVLTIRNAGRSNALSPTMMAQLHDVVEELEAFEGSCLIVTGEGERAFCAGADLEFVRAWSHDKSVAHAMGHYMQGLTTRLHELPLVSVSAIEGAAVGGGAELMTATDHRVLSSSAQVRFVHARLGMAPGWGGGVRLTRLLGRRPALRLMSTARRVHADEALELGLVDAVCVPGQALQAAREFLAPVLALPAASVRAVKAQAVAAERSLEAGQDVALRHFEELWGGSASQEALKR